MSNLLNLFLRKLNIDPIGFSVKTDSPDNPAGETWIDISHDSFSTSVSYSPKFGFGFYLLEEIYGQRPDEVYLCADKAVIRVGQLAHSFLEYGRLNALNLGNIRELCGETQDNIAAKIGIKQPSVQRLEQRLNPQINTLSNYVKSLGGRLETRVFFDDMEAPFCTSEYVSRKTSSVRKSTSPTVSLLVLRASEPDKLVSFYEKIGADFTTEKHGTGPVHCSTKLGSTIFEIYPRQKNEKRTFSQVGLSVNSIEDTLMRLGSLGQVISPPEDTPYGRICILKDTEGHTIHLEETSPTLPSTVRTSS